jgi:hypothetical protein
MKGWTYITKHGEADIEIAKIVAEIEEDSDRSAGIVAAAFVEDQLTHLLKSRLRYEDEKIMREMFRSRGPLGTFSAKIDMGYLMRLYSEEARRELETIKDIRNSFAHRMPMKNFQAQSIRALANNLKIGEELEVYLRLLRKGPQPKRVRIEVGAEFPIAMGIGKCPKGYRTFLPRLKKDQTLDPRQKYLRACQFFSAAFGVLLFAPPASSLERF